MRRNVLLVLVPLTLVAAEAAQDAAKEELKKLEGAWVMMSGEENGEKVPEQRLKEAKMTIAGDKHTVMMGKDTLVGTHKLDPSKNPKEIDATNPEQKGKAMLGIYKLEGDLFTVCFAPPGKDRPQEFTSKSGTGEFVHVWKREKK